MVAAKMWKYLTNSGDGNYQKTLVKCAWKLM